MKELSIEEKARAYDEAIKYAHYLINERCKEDTDGSFHRADLNRMFPKLAESDDERIIGVFREFAENFLFWEKYELTKGKALAWFEKQVEKGTNGNEREIPNSEQKPADKVEPKFKVGDIIRHKKQGFTCEIIAVDTEYRLSGCNGSHLPFEWQDAYELVEQIPTWSEKYIADVFEKVGLAKIAREQSNDNLTNALQDAMIELSKFISQPKQEWSERDKEEFHIAIETLAEAGQYDSAHWLQFLKERYVWKPSDEQMAALNAISVTGVISDAEQGQELVNLYNVLRRLRGE